VNVPNVVDNLWEWLRPAEFPNRRSSVFAAPTEELARREGPENGVVCRVDLPGDYNMCQLRGYSNSKKHPDCVALPILMYDRLGDDWINEALPRKLQAGQLWLPCVTKEEVECLFSEVEVLRNLRGEIAEKVRYWSDVVRVDSRHPCVDAEGEVFFTTAAGFYLTPVSR